MPCSMRRCWLTLRCTSACMRCDEAEFGLPLAALFSSRLIWRLSWFCARWMRAFSAGLSLPSFAAFDSMRSMRASPLSSCEASRVLSDPLFSPCSMRCCWFTSRCTSEPTVWAEAAAENRPATATAMTVAAAFMCASLKFFMKCLPERLTPVPARGLPANGKKCNSLYSTSLRTLTVSILRGSIARSCRNTPNRRVEAGPAAAGPKIESQLGGGWHGSDGDARAGHWRLSAHALHLQHPASVGAGRAARRERLSRSVHAHLARHARIGDLGVHKGAVRA